MKFALICAIFALAVMTAVVQGRSCICTANYQPVCGTSLNGLLRFYSNACVARCAGATIVSSSACPRSHIIRDEETQSDQDDVQSDPDVSRQLCACPKSYAPVCANGRTYSNIQCARCQRVTKWTPGACATDTSFKQCICPAIWSPVCANKDGKQTQFSNSCSAECSGVTDYTKGVCD